MSDATRPTYRQLTDQELAVVQDVQLMGSVLLKGLDAAFQGRQSRELSLAKTKVEEAVMWAILGLTA